MEEVYDICQDPGWVGDSAPLLPTTQGSPIAPQSLKLSRHCDTSLAMVAVSRTASDIQDTHIFLSKFVLGGAFLGGGGILYVLLVTSLYGSVSILLIVCLFFHVSPFSSGSWMEEGQMTWQGQQTNKQKELK